jgi:hypothetical protein
MGAYLKVLAGYVGLSIYLHLLFRWWYGRLTTLAARYDLAERRRRASREALMVMLLVAIPTLAVLLGSMIHTAVSGFFIISIFILSLGSAVIWYVRRIPRLRALGYGASRINDH